MIKIRFSCSSYGWLVGSKGISSPFNPYIVYTLVHDYNPNIYPILFTVVHAKVNETAQDPPNADDKETWLPSTWQVIELKSLRFRV